MTERKILRLIVPATLINGLLAGGNLHRATIDMPAWRRVGPRGWAAFSRHADLGPYARFVYPVEAFSGTILSLAAARLCARDPELLRGVRVPIYTAAALASAGLLTTVRAAPFMLSLRHLGDDPEALQQAFDGFELWGGVRGVFQVLAGCASLWSLVALLLPRRQTAAQERRIEAA